MKTLRGFGRLLTELPQPARAGLWIGYGAFLAGVLLGIVLGGAAWAMFSGAGISGAAIALTGWCLFRDTAGAATEWSRIYREARGVPPDGFTFGDVPTVRAQGLLYLALGIFFMAVAAGSFMEQ